MQYVYNHHLIKADDRLASNCSIHKIISDRPTEERQEGREEDRMRTEMREGRQKRKALMGSWRGYVSFGEVYVMPFKFIV